ncbi:ABC transporter substrate-binding protein [Pollutimonas sp. M17]|uniref:ABC transporter substrate-binding protein n=1 Tax=Pollutimonas sp. M17 TaxID=2962065 RepID=UPI0021F4FA22|nr:ABC transporter substrate-binding protein [Pollutimonas sp. M17]UYO92558.1 ABC transporter substrate-binding protein [Pollutimonas sp. M17]HWK69750.1 ABC transporter substrate-binding protein [Burkholderiaceae bacterium]
MPTVNPTIKTIAVALACAFAGLSQAQTLKIGLASEPTAVDPHYHQTTPNEALIYHIFQPLVAMDADQKLQPALAKSWEATDDTTWTFKLDEKARFSNGEPFTAQDVVFSFCRILNNETGIGSGGTNTVRRIVSVETPDERTVLLKTAAPQPVLPNELARIPMIWSGIVKHDTLTYTPKEGCGVTSPWPAVNDFNSGKDVIGTGPYVLKSYVKGSGIVLERNEKYWGEQPAWKEVRMTAVPSAGPRLTGLLAGDFDLIENPAARDLKRIKESGFGHTVKPSVRIMFFQLDAGREQSPMVKSPKGDNPLQNAKVRQAMSLAIDRKTIVERIMDGVAMPANQFIPAGMFGAIDQAPALEYNPKKAKALLAEAGYPDGFELTLSATNDRYINDAQVTQAVAQYLSRIGIKTQVDTMTSSVYFPKRAKREMSAALGGWGQETGEAGNFLQYWVATNNKDRGVGSSNYGRYSNPELDKLYFDAMGTLDDGKRSQLLQQAVKIALADMPHIPLHWESGVWAFRKGISYEGRADQRTMATAAKPAK